MELRFYISDRAVDWGVTIDLFIGVKFNLFGFNFGHNFEVKGIDWFRSIFMETKVKKSISSKWKIGHFFQFLQNQISVQSTGNILIKKLTKMSERASKSILRTQLQRGNTLPRISRKPSLSFVPKVSRMSSILGVNLDHLELPLVISIRRDLDTLDPPHIGQPLEHKGILSSFLEVVSSRIIEIAGHRSRALLSFLSKNLHSWVDVVGSGVSVGGSCCGDVVSLRSLLAQLELWYPLPRFTGQKSSLVVEERFLRGSASPRHSFVKHPFVWGVCRKNQTLDLTNVIHWVSCESINLTSQKVVPVGVVDLFEIHNFSLFALNLGKYITVSACIILPTSANFQFVLKRWRLSHRKKYKYHQLDLHFRWEKIRWWGWDDSREWEIASGPNV